MAGDSAFETVLRGYDRRQVDEFILRQEEAAETLRTALAETERKLQVATESAELLEAENRRLHESVTKQREAAKEQGFGARAEKLLQVAESEAAELRSRTVRESADLMEQSRAAAEGTGTRPSRPSSCAPLNWTSSLHVATRIWWSARNRSRASAPRCAPRPTG
jgi:cell division septum initiation protein DivIVA